MRKNLLLLFFVVSISAKGQTSVYHPFPDSGAVWIMNYTHWCTNSSIGCLYSCNSNYQYRQDGDTLISGNIYTKVFKDSYLQRCSCIVISPPNPWSTPSCIQYPFDSYFFGGIRNDSVNKKVYFIQDANYPERILYDFNLNVGDTLTGVFCSNKPIVKIDSVLVGSDYRKCYWLDTINLFNDRIIEGIGHVGNFPYGGPFDGCWLITGDYVWGLSCFIVNGNVLYGDSSCSLVTHVNNIHNEEPTIILSPNPAISEFTIYDLQFTISRLEIYNVLGEKIYSQQPETSNQQHVTIDVSQLLPGIYFLKVRGEKEERVAKFVKQ